MMLLNNFFTDFFVGVDHAQLADFLVRLAFNLVSIFILIRFIYYPNNGQIEHLYTYFMMAAIIFFVASSLSHVKIEFGFALGLFAIFSIIRFRTPPVDAKEMTYLFTAIGISIINALVEYQMSDWHALLVINFIILLLAYGMEKYKPRKNVDKKQLTFTLFDFQILNDKKQLLEEVKKQTNLNIFKVEIQRINATKKEVTVWIYYK